MLGGCGSGPGVSATPSAQPVIENNHNEESQDEPVVAVQEVFPWDASQVLLAEVRWQCANASEGMYCDRQLSAISTDALEHVGDGLKFHRPGLFLMQDMDRLKLVHAVSKNSLDVSPVPFKVRVHRDRLYAHVYHFEIFPEIQPQASWMIQWDVQGGRYHFFDEDMDYVKVLRPMQRSLLLQEENSYEVTIRMGVPGEAVHIQKVILHREDVSKIFSQQEIEGALYVGRSPELGVRGFILEGDIPENDSWTHEWRVQKIELFDCPDQIKTHLDPIFRDQICNHRIEKDLVLDEDYELRSGKNFQAHLILKKAGRYAISLVVTEPKNQITHQFSKSIDVP